MQKPSCRACRVSIGIVLITIGISSAIVMRFVYLRLQADYHERTAMAVACTLAGIDRDRLGAATLSYNPIPGSDAEQIQIDPDKPYLYLVDDGVVRVISIKDKVMWRVGLNHRNSAVAYRRASCWPWGPEKGRGKSKGSGFNIKE